MTDLLWLETGQDVLDVLTRYREGYHEEALRRGGGDSEMGVDGAEAAPSIHDIEESATLERLPPVDAHTRCLVRERVIPASQTAADYADATFHEGTLALQWVEDTTPETATPETPTPVAGTLVEAEPASLTWSFRCADPPATKRLTLHEDGTLEHEWRWEPHAFPEGARFAPELSLGAEVAVDTESDVERWRYPIVTTSKCPDGFEDIEQGVSITPLWPIAIGAARMTIRPRAST